MLNFSRRALFGMLPASAVTSMTSSTPTRRKAPQIAQLKMQMPYLRHISTGDYRMTADVLNEHASIINAHTDALYIIADILRKAKITD